MIIERRGFPPIRDEAANGWGTQARLFGVVASHPFARKKAKGWGTGVIWVDQGFLWPGPWFLTPAFQPITITG